MNKLSDLNNNYKLLKKIQNINLNAIIVILNPQSLPTDDLILEKKFKPVIYYFNSCCYSKIMGGFEFLGGGKVLCLIRK